MGLSAARLQVKVEQKILATKTYGLDFHGVGDGEEVPLVVKKYTVVVRLQRHDKSLVESWFDVLVSFCSVSRVYVHCESIELFHTCQTF